MRRLSFGDPDLDAVSVLETGREAESVREVDREVVEDCRDVDLELDHGSEMSRRRDMEVSLSFSLSFSLELSLSVKNGEGECRRERVGSTAEADFSE